MTKTIIGAVSGLGSTDPSSAKRVADQINAYNKKLRIETENDVQKIREKYDKKLAKADDKDREKYETRREKAIARRKKASEDELAAYSLLLAYQNTEDEKKRRKEINKELAKYQASDFSDGLKANAKAQLKNIGYNAAEVGKQALNAIAGSVEKYLDVYVRYYSAINTRLQNTGLTYNKINDLFKGQAAANPYLKYESLLENLNTLVELGIAENVTQRAFFGTISDKIATTFNVAQESMLELIRIQQADTTAARLGMEANLTRLFNSYFHDTSYLNQVYDTVQAALIDTSAMFPSTEASVEFEYIVQKWLGSLGSVGVNESTLTSIAQGINALATGDVDYLTSNSAMQNLLVMSASRVGLNYGDILSRGLSSSDVNILLKSVIEYIQTILQSNNNVVKKQYASLFGVTISDLAAFSNLTNDTINNLYNTVLSYDGTIKEVESQLKQIGSRTHISEMINNVLENTLMSMGVGVANNSIMYATYKAADMIEKITGGIQLPFVSVLGSGMDLNMTLEGLVKGGIIGISAVSSLVSAVSNMFSGGFLDPNKYKLETSGQGFTTWSKPGELIETTSATTVVSNVSETGMSQSLVEQQKQTGESVTGKKEEINIEEEYYKPYKSSLSTIIELLKGTLSVNIIQDFSTSLTTSPGNPQTP